VVQNPLTPQLYRMYLSHHESLPHLDVLAEKKKMVKNIENRNFLVQKEKIVKIKFICQN